MTQPAAEPCTTWSANRRHYSTTLTAGTLAGREGTALCRTGGREVEVYDETSINRQMAPYRAGKPPIVVADLPECKACARALTKLETNHG